MTVGGAAAAASDDHRGDLTGYRLAGDVVFGARTARCAEEPVGIF